MSDLYDRLYRCSGNWQYLNPSEAVFKTQWTPGRMIVYSLGNRTTKHFRIALVKDNDPHFCKEFVVSSPESQIEELRIGKIVEITFKNGDIICMEGMKPAGVIGLSRIFSTVHRPEVWGNGTSDFEFFHDPEVGGVALSGLYRLWEAGQLTDITLIAGGDSDDTSSTSATAETEVACHRAVLAASSEYFRVMLCGQFVEAGLSRVRLSAVSGAVLRRIVNYMYSGSIELKVRDVQAVFSAAHMLQLTKLEDWCAAFMLSHLADNNCTGVYFFAKSFNQEKLRKAALKKIASGFHFVVREEEFLRLNAESVCEILQLDKIENVPEHGVYEAAVTWLEFDFEARKKDMFRVMKNIRYTDFDKGYFQSIIMDHKMFKDCEPLQDLFEKVNYYMIHPYRWHEVDFIMETRGDRMPSMQLPQAVLYSALDADGRTSLHIYALSPRHRAFDPSAVHRPRPSSTPWYLHQGRTGAHTSGSAAAAATGGNSGGKAEKGEKGEKRWDVNSLVEPCMATLTVPSRDIYFTNSSSNSKGGEMGVCKEQIGYGDIMPTREGYTWNLLPSLNHHRKQYCLAAVDCFLYAIGGCHKNKLVDCVEKYGYNPGLESWGWVPVAPLPCRLRGCCATSFRGKLYVFGGESPAKKRSRGYLSPNVFRYDPETDRWSTMSPMKEARTMARCAIYKGKIYVIGGMTVLDDAVHKGSSGEGAAGSSSTSAAALGGGGETSTCELYDPVTDEWEYGPPAPRTIAAPGVVKYKGTIFVLGGMAGGTALRSVYRLNDAGDAWMSARSSALYHPPHVRTHLYSCFTTINITPPHYLGPHTPRPNTMHPNTPRPDTTRPSTRAPNPVPTPPVPPPPPPHPNDPIYDSDSDSETTWGTSMEQAFTDSTTDDDDDDDDDGGARGGGEGALVPKMPKMSFLQRRQAERRQEKSRAEMERDSDSSSDDW